MLLQVADAQDSGNESEGRGKEDHRAETEIAGGHRPLRPLADRQLLESDRRLIQISRAEQAEMLLFEHERFGRHVSQPLLGLGRRGDDSGGEAAEKERIHLDDPQQGPNECPSDSRSLPLRVHHDSARCQFSQRAAEEPFRQRKVRDAERHPHRKQTLIHLVVQRVGN